LPKKNILKIDHLDKYVHFILFFGLEILILIEFRAKKRNVHLTSILVIAFMPLVYAAITELIQLFFILDRDGTWQDFIADIIGIFVGIIFYTLYTRRATNLS
jgi:VanZ family protein